MRAKSIVVLLSSVLILVFACSDDSTGPEPEPVVDPEIGEFLMGLPSWDEFSEPLDPAHELESSTSEERRDGDDRYVCTTSTYSLTDTPEEVVTFAAGGDLLWPGALIQGDSYKQGLGAMKELPIRQRAPVTISIDILSGDNSRTIENPDLASVNSAVGELMALADAEGHKVGSSAIGRDTFAYNAAQAALGLKLSITCAPVKAKLSSAISHEESTWAVYFKQKMFTVNFVQPQTPESVFSPEFTKELLQQQIDLGNVGQNNLPVYVAQVVYGRILLLTVTSSATRAELESAIGATIKGVELEAKAEASAVMQSAKKEVIAIGCDGDQALELLTTGDLHTMFRTGTSITTARPIAYTLRNLGDNSLATVAETTEYQTSVCELLDTNMLPLSAWRTAVQGNDGYEIRTWQPTLEQIALSDEYGLIQPNQLYYGQYQFGRYLTFPGSSTGWHFDFAIKKSDHTAGQLTYNDCERRYGTWGLIECAFANAMRPLLSPGDNNDSAPDDDFEIIITRVDPGYEVCGIGVDIGGNALSQTTGTSYDEFLEVYEQDGTFLKQFVANPVDPGLWPVTDTSYAFTGVYSDVPLGRYWFNEGSLDRHENEHAHWKLDDICIQNIYFGVRRTP